LIEIHKHPVMQKLTDSKSELNQKTELYARMMILEYIMSRNKTSQVESFDIPISDPDKKLN